MRPIDWVSELFSIPAHEGRARQQRRSRKAACRALALEDLEPRRLLAAWNPAVDSALHEVAPQAFTAGFDTFLANLSSSLDDTLRGFGSLPLVGDQLAQAVQPTVQDLDRLNQHMNQAITRLYASATLESMNLVDGFQSTLFDVVGTPGLNLLLDGPDEGAEIGTTDVSFSTGSDWVQFDIHLGQEYHVDVPLDLALSSGNSQLADLLPGLDFAMAANNGVRMQFQWDAYIGIGFSATTDLGFYFNSGAQENFSGDSAPEFEASISVFAAPSKDAAGNDVFSAEPGLSAGAAVGLLQATVTDGTESQIGITASNALNALAGSFGGDFDLVVTTSEGQTETLPVSVSANNVADLTTRLALAINTAVTDRFDFEGGNPLPFAVIPDFTVDPDPTTVGDFKLLLRSRELSIVAIEVRDGDELGFDNVQYENERSQSLGFDSGQSSIPSGANQVLTAALAAPASGQLAEDVDFFLVVGDNTLPIILRAEDLNDDLTELDSEDPPNQDESTEMTLKQALQAAIDKALSQSFPLAELPTIEVNVTPNGEFELVAAPVADGPAPVMTVNYQSLDKSKLTLKITVDLVSASFDEDEFDPDDEDTFDRVSFKELYDAKSGADAEEEEDEEVTLSDFFEVQAQAEGEIRLRVNADANAGGIPGFAKQSLGIIDVSLGLPGVQYDFKWDLSATASLDVDTREVETEHEIGNLYFDNILLDPGSLLNSLIEPVGGVFDTVLGPVLDVIGSGSPLLNLNLPVISSIFGNTTLAGLLPGGSQLSSFLDDIASLADFIDGAAGVLSQGKPIALGSWLVDLDEESPTYFGAINTPIPSELSVFVDGVSSISIAELFELLPPEPPGLSIEILQPANFLNMVLGRPFEIVSFGLPDDVDLGIAPGLSAGPFGIDIGVASLSFGITASSSLSIEAAKLQIVYDSTGIEQVVDTIRAGVKPDYTSLLDGIYLTIPDGNAAEVNLSFAGSGSGSASFLGETVISVSAGLGLTGNAFLKLNDVNDDGQLRLNEIFAHTNDLSDPSALLSLFDAGVNLGGYFNISASAGGLNVTQILADLGLPNSFAVSAGISLQDVFGATTTVADPVQTLGEVIAIDGQSVLRLNTGPFAGNRLVGDTDDDSGATIQISGSPGVLIVSGFGTSQTFTGNYARILAIGGAGADRFDLSGVSGISVEVRGGGGNDVILGGAGNDLLDAGNGSLVVIDAAQGGNDVIVGGAGANTITTGSSSATIYAGSGNHTINLGTGHATVYTQTGNHTVTGGGGNNTFVLGTGDNHITTGAGSATITGGTGNDFIDATANSVGLNYRTGGGDDSVLGSAFNDVLTATGTGNVRFEGRGGNDTLTAGSGDAVIDGGAGDDRITGGSGVNTIVLGTGNNVVITGVGRAQITDGLGDDFIDAAASGGGMIFSSVGGNDTVLGSAFRDILTATGTGHVRLEGRGGNDLLMGAGGNDILLGGEGNDRLSGGAGIDTLVGGDGENTLFASFEDAVVQGGSVHDTFVIDGTQAAGLIMTTPGVVRQGTRTIAYKAGDNITVNLGPSDDVVDVRDVVANLTVNAGEGSNTLDVAAATGSVTITGGAGPDAVTISDITGAADVGTGDGINTVDVRRITGAASITGGAGADQIAVHSIGGVLTANTGSGADTVTVSMLGAGSLIATGSDDDHLTATDINTAVSLDTGSGNDSLIATSLSGAMTTILLRDGDDTVDVNHVIGPVLLSSGTGDNTINLNSLSGPGGSEFTFGANSNGGQNRVNVGQLSSSLSIQGVSDPLAPQTQLAIGRSQDPTPQVATLTATTLAWAGQSPITYGDVQSLQIDLGNGDDAFTINDTSALTTTTLNALGGQDRITVSQVSSLTVINGGVGNDMLTALVPGDPTLATFISDLRFDVETVVLDNSGYSEAVDWTYSNPVLGMDGVTVLDAIGAGRVRLIAGVSAANTLAVLSENAAPQRMQIGGQSVEIAVGAKVLNSGVFTPAATLSPTLTGFESLAVSPDGQTTYAVGSAIADRSTAFQTGVSTTPLISSDIYNNANYTYHPATSLTNHAGSADLVLAVKNTLVRLPGNSNFFSPAGGSYSEQYVLSNTIFYMSGTSTLVNTQQVLAVATADLNQDGSDDIAVAAAGNAEFSTVRTDSSGNSFISGVHSGTLSGGAIALGDVNGDGKPDAAFVLSQGINFSQVYVQMNTTPVNGGPVSYVSGAVFDVVSPRGLGPTSRLAFIDIADLNGDGKPDLIVANGTYADSSNAFVSVMLNTTPLGALTPSFSAAVSFPVVNGIDAGSLTATDISGDGRPDLVIAASSAASSGIYIMVNTTPVGSGTPSFAAKQEFVLSAGGGQTPVVLTSDIDGDNSLDLVFGNGITTAVLLNDTAPGNMTAAFETIHLSSSGIPMVMGDFDGDGKPDLAVRNPRPAIGALATVTIFKNDVIPAGSFDRLFVTAPDGGSPSTRNLGLQSAVVTNQSISNLYSIGTNGGLNVYRHSDSAVIQSISGFDPNDRVVVSSDDKNVYVLSALNSHVINYRRNAATGELALENTTAVPTPAALAFSADGLYAYATDPAGILRVYSRSTTTGRLTLLETFENQVNGVDGLGMAGDVIVSDDGLSVYVAGPGQAAIANFDRDPATGRLTFVSSVKNGFGGVLGLGGIAGLASTTADGVQYVFAIGGTDNSLATFRRDPNTHRLIFAQRLVNGSGGVQGLENPTAVLVDGNQVVVASLGAGAIQGGLTRFDIAQDVPPPIVYHLDFEGTLDSLSVTSGEGDDNIRLAAVSISDVTLDAGDGLNTVTLLDTAAGSNVAIQLGGGHDTINIRTTGGNSTTLLTDAGGNNAFDVFRTGAGSEVTLTGGSGNDTFRIDGTQIGNPITISGGDGTNRLEFDAHSETVEPQSPQLPAGTVTVTGSANVVAYGQITTLDLLASPVVNAGGPYMIAQGQSLTLADLTIVPAGRSVTSARWDLDGDDSFGEATGLNPTLSWTDLIALGLADNGTYTIYLRLTLDTGVTALGSATVVVTPVAPTLNALGDSTVAALTTYTLDLSATDISPADQVESWTVNWGDGLVDAYAAGSLTATHQYALRGAYTIDIAATDDDGTYAVAKPLSVTYRTLEVGGAASAPEGTPYGLNLTGLGLNIESWLINWGDGTPAETVAGNPPFVSHTFATENTYTISAQIQDPAQVGLEAVSNTQQVTITTAPPILTLTGASSADEHSPYSLTLSAVAVGADTVTSWLVNWGDGTPAEAVAGAVTLVTHEYANEGLYTISATALDTDGGPYAADNTVTVVVADLPPVPTVAGAATVDEGANYTLTLQSNPRFDPITGWTINWGDGTSNRIVGDATSISHIFARDGRYTIAAEVQTSGGLFAAQSTVTADVANVPPAASISGNASVDEGATYTLDLQAVAGGDAILGWNIVWGDGTRQLLSSDASSVTHTYLEDGQFSISAAVRTADGLFLAGSPLALNVVPASPVLTLAGAASVVEGSAYKLNLAASLFGQDTLSQWTINWGDNSPLQIVDGSATVVSHVYADGLAVYTIGATGTDDDGAIGVSNPLLVTVNDAPPVVLVSGLATVFEGSVYTLDLKDADPGTGLGDQISGWLINWGDGSDAELVVGDADSVTHTYVDGGPTTADPATGVLIAAPASTYTIAATAFQGLNSFVAAPISVGVLNVDPQVELSGADEVEESAEYTLTIKVADPGLFDSFTLDIEWGDPTSPSNSETFTYPASATGSQTITLTHRYLNNKPSGADPATYTIDVSVSDNNGASKSVSHDVLVMNVAPDFEAGPDETVPPPSLGSFSRSLAFTDPGTLDTFSGTVDFGDGAGPQALTIAPLTRTFDLVHVYPNTTSDPAIFTYLVTVTVTDNDLGSRIDTFEVTVNLNTPPVATDDTPTADEDHVVSLNVLANDIDNQNNIVPSATVNLTSPAAGILTNNHDGTLSFDPNGEFEYLAVGESTTVTFDYKVLDVFGESDIGTVTITVQGRNDAPAITGITSSHPIVESRASIGAPVTINGSFSDVDISDVHTVTVDWGDGSAAELVSVTEPIGSFVGSHGYGSGGFYQITVTLDDGQGGIDVIHTTAVVTGVGLVDGTLYAIGTEGRDRFAISVRSLHGGRKEMRVLSNFGLFSFDADDVLSISAFLGGGNDRLTISNQISVNAFIDGGAGNDVINSGAGDDTIVDMSGHTIIRAGLGNDIVTTGSGNDRIDAGAGNDQITTGSGNDYIIAGTGNDIVFAGAGNDRVDGGDGNDVLSGGHGNDDLQGGNGFDILIGGIGNDKLKGGRDNDLLIGGSAVNENDLTLLDAALADWAAGDLTAALLDLGALTDDGDKDKLKGEKGLDELIGGIGGKRKQNA